MGPQEGEEYTEPYLKLGCSVGRWGPWGTHRPGLSYEQERSWRVRRTVEEMVLGLWFRKMEGTQRWAQGPFVDCGQGLLILPSIKTPFSFPYQEKDLGACSRGALLTWPCPSLDCGQPGLLLHCQNPPGKGSVQRRSPEEGAGRLPHLALLGSTLRENRVHRGRRG